MKYEDLIGYKIVDVAEKGLSKKKAFILKKGNSLLMLRSENLDLYYVEERKGLSK